MSVKIQQKPLLFSTPMVLSLMDGSKTQTRRRVKPPKKVIGDFESIPFIEQLDCERIKPKITQENKVCFSYFNGAKTFYSDPVEMPVKVGSVIWVRETFAKNGNGFVYKAGFKGENVPTWKPSIFMPKNACRLFLRVTGVSIEKIGDISEKDAIAEGIRKLPNGNYFDYLDTSNKEGLSPIWSFFSLWESINGKKRLNCYSWVWTLEKIKNTNYAT